MTKSIAQWQIETHTLAKKLGWYDEAAGVKSSIEQHMLMVSELAEATEEARKRGLPHIYQYLDKETIAEPGTMDWYADLKPEGELIELADVVLRILDYCESRGWDLEQAMHLKHEYNKTRPYRHGGKKY